MKRWAAFGILAGFGFVLSGSCQGPDAFYRLDTPGIGGRGVGGTGFGGFVGLGGSLGLGGAFTGFGGRGAGGSGVGTGGRGTGGGLGAAGTTGSGGRAGVDAGSGVGGSGAGGRTFDAGVGCVATMIANGYAAGTATPCSMCRENGNPLTDKCMAIINCIAPMYPCTGCFTDCSNQNGGSGPVNDCVRALVSAACGP